MLCTSGTAAANFHPAICEADDSAVPLIALTADRPPELRGIGAGQAIDQLKLYGDSVRWFCEVGTHAADDQGLLHYRSAACRAFAAARGEPRAGPVHLNLAWREPLAPLAGRGRGHGDRSAGTGGPRRAAADRGPADRHGALAVPARRGRQAHRRGRDRRDRRRPPARPRAARAARPPRRAPPATRSSPSRPPSSAAGPTTAPTSSPPTTCCCATRGFRRAASPDLVLRFGEMPTSKPLRSWLAESGADQIVVDPLGGWNEPSRRAAAILRADPTELAAGWAARLGEERPPPAMWLDADRAARIAIEAELAALDALERAGPAATPWAEPTVTATSSTPRRACRSATRSPSCRGGGPTYSSSAIAAPTESTAWSPPASAPPTPPAARPRSSPATSASCTTSAGWRPYARSRPRSGSSPSTTTAAASSTSFPRRGRCEGDEFEALLGTPRGVDVAKTAALFDLPHRALDDLAELPDALAAGTGLIEVKADRQANLDLHRHLVERIAAAIR